MRSNIRCGVCSACLLISPDAAGGGLGPCSRRLPATGVVLVFCHNYCSDPSYLFIRIDTHLVSICHMSWKKPSSSTGSVHSMRFSSWCSQVCFFVFLVWCFFHLFCLTPSGFTTEYFVLIVRLGPDTPGNITTAVRRIIHLACVYIECCCRCGCNSVCCYKYTAVVAAVAAAVRHRVPDRQKFCWFIESEQVAFAPWASLIGGSIPSVYSFGVPFFVHLLFVWRRVVSQPSTSRIRSTRYYTAAVRRVIHLPCIYTECSYRCCCSLCCYACVAAAAAAVRHRVPDGKYCCWLIESDSIQSFFSFIQTRFF